MNKGGKIAVILGIVVIGALVLAGSGSALLAKGAGLEGRFGLAGMAVQIKDRIESVFSGRNVRDDAQKLVFFEEIGYDDKTNKGTMDISLGACSLDVAATEDQAASIRSTIGDIKVLKGGDSDGRLTIAITEDEVLGKIGEVNRLTEIDMGTGMTWKVHVDTGASRLKMDLRDVAVERLEVEAGAGGVNIRLGERTSETEVAITGGISSIAINVPEGAAVRIVKENGLSGVDYGTAGLVKIGEGVYESPGFEDAPSRITIRLSTGLSGIRLMRE